MSNQTFKTYGEDGDDNTELFKIPETKSILSSLQDTLQAAHQEMEQEEDEKDKKDGKPKKKKKKSNAICCCGNAFCRIGPFTETQDGGEENV